MSSRPKKRLKPKTEPLTWIERNQLARAVGGKGRLVARMAEYGAVIATTTMTRWVKKEGTEGANEPKEFDAEILLRIWNDTFSPTPTPSEK